MCNVRIINNTLDARKGLMTIKLNVFRKKNQKVKIKNKLVNKIYTQFTIILNNRSPQQYYDVSSQMYFQLFLNSSKPLTNFNFSGKLFHKLTSLKFLYILPAR